MFQNNLSKAGENIRQLTQLRPEEKKAKSRVQNTRRKKSEKITKKLEINS